MNFKEEQSLKVLFLVRKILRKGTGKPKNFDPFQDFRIVGLKMLKIDFQFSVFKTEKKRVGNKSL